jgi:hypothetical protein
LFQLLEHLATESAPDETALVIDEPLADFPGLIVHMKEIAVQDFSETVQAGGDKKQQKH